MKEILTIIWTDLKNQEVSLLNNTKILYGPCKVQKTITDVCPPFRPILSAIETPSYKLAKFLVPKLSSITFNEFTAKDSFAFAE